MLFHASPTSVFVHREEAKERKSLGLVGMQERALLLSGELKVEGVPGAGTTMTLRIPLPPTTLPEQDSR